MVLERSVIRWLYGRPLETLLATWGISLILMQCVRSLFGAQNVQVDNPSWMSGGVQALPNLVLPYSRIVIIAVRSRGGGRDLAAAHAHAPRAVRARRDPEPRHGRAASACRPRASTRWPSASAAGIAGLAGCALSQIGNVGPDARPGYIVDSFMVVVLGGVGQLAGTVYAGMGLGLVNKLLESWSGAVLAKIAVLVFIIIFIQKRPQGLFALKGRAVEA